MWNIHFTIPMPAIGVPYAMPTEDLGSGRGVMDPTKSIFYGEMYRIALVSKIMVSRYV